MAETCKRCGERLGGGTLPYNEDTCLRCHIEVTEDAWIQTGRLDIGLLGTAALTQHPHWSRLLDEFDILKKAIAAFDAKLWTAGLQKHLAYDEPVALEASFGDLSVGIWNEPSSLFSALRLIDIKRGETHLGLSHNQSNPPHFATFQICATLGEATALLSDVVTRWDVSKFKSIKV
jgi:hypothetical protein